MENLLKELKEQTKKLGKTEVVIESVGVYPNRKRTPVEDVAIYQNDGTPTIKPAKFVERSARKNNDWNRIVGEAVSEFLDGDEKKLDDAGRKIARDINDEVDRIDTGRLKHSMKHKIDESK
jgi:hypothetical protein